MKKTRYEVLKLMIISILLLSTCEVFSQERDKLKFLLDSLNLDYNLTPNKVLKDGRMGNDIIWAGKIDSIEIDNMNNKIELFFYCNHRNFDQVSKDKILSRNLLLKEDGDGDFVLSIISDKMTLEDAEKIVFTYAKRSTNYILTIGKAINTSNKYNKKYVSTVTYYFYIFK